MVGRPRVTGAGRSESSAPSPARHGGCKTSNRRAAMDAPDADRDPGHLFSRLFSGCCGGSRSGSGCAQSVAEKRALLADVEMRVLRTQQVHRHAFEIRRDRVGLAENLAAQFTDHLDVEVEAPMISPALNLFVVVQIGPDNRRRLLGLLRVLHFFILPY